ncbi:MAG: hypothetical protein V7L01_01270 [Nostoc sp.]
MQFLIRLLSFPKMHKLPRSHNFFYQAIAAINYQVSPNDLN